MVFDCRKECKNRSYCVICSLCLDVGCNTSSIIHSCLPVWDKWALLVCGRRQHTSYHLCHTCHGAQAESAIISYFSRDDFRTLWEELPQGILIFCTYDKYHSYCHAGFGRGSCCKLAHRCQYLCSRISHSCRRDHLYFLWRPQGNISSRVPQHSLFVHCCARFCHSSIFCQPPDWGNLRDVCQAYKYDGRPTCRRKSWRLIPYHGFFWRLNIWNNQHC